MKHIQLHAYYAAITIMLVLCANISAGQNYRRLLKKELSPDVSKETVIGGTLDILTSGGQPEGTIGGNGCGPVTNGPLDIHRAAVVIRDCFKNATRILQ